MTEVPILNDLAIPALPLINKAPVVEDVVSVSAVTANPEEVKILVKGLYTTTLSADVAEPTTAVSDGVNVIAWIAFVEAN